MPTQAPTGSTSRSRELTAILLREPGSRAEDSMRTIFFVNLRDFLFEQLFEQALVGARQHNLRSAGVFLDVDDESDETITDAIVFALDLLAHRQDGFRLAEVDDDVAALEATDDAGDQLTFAIAIFVERVVTLGFANALDDDLLGRLRRDATEALDGVVQIQQIAVLRLLLSGPLGVSVGVEDLEQQLVTDLGPQACRAAASRGMSRPLVPGCSVTMQTWKRSTWPVSSLNCASSSRSRPNTFLAAVRMALAQGLG